MPKLGPEPQGIYDDQGQNLLGWLSPNGSEVLIAGFGGSGSMVYPSSDGIVTYNGSGWGASYSVTGTGNVVMSSGGTFSIANATGLTSGQVLGAFGSSIPANEFVASPNGSAGALTSRAIVAADIPTLNQNTTGTAAAIAGGAANEITYQSAAGVNGFIPAPGNNTYLNWTSASGFAWVTLASGSGITALTGDVAASGTGSVAATLATVNSNVGTFGSSSSVPVVTVNAKGLVTAVTTAAVSGGGSSVSYSRTVTASGNMANGDLGNIVLCNTASNAVVMTILAQSNYSGISGTSTPFEFTILQTSANYNASFLAGSGVTFVSSSPVSGVYAQITAQWVAADTYRLIQS